MSSEWKDISEFRRSDIERKPKCFQLKVGSELLILVWNHLYCPNSWSISMSGFFDVHDLKTSYEDLEIAKLKAKELAIFKVKQMLEDLE